MGASASWSHTGQLSQSAVRTGSPPFRASSELTPVPVLAKMGAESMVAAAVAEVLVMNFLLVSLSFFMST